MLWCLESGVSYQKLSHFGWRRRYQLILHQPVLHWWFALLLEHRQCLQSHRTPPEGIQSRPLCVCVRMCVEGVCVSGACEGVCVEGMYCGVVIIIDGYRRFVVALIIKNWCRQFCLYHNYILTIIIVDVEDAGWLINYHRIIAGGQYKVKWFG